MSAQIEFVMDPDDVARLIRLIDASGDHNLNALRDALWIELDAFVEEWVSELPIKRPVLKKAVSR